jgi:FtsH-binding integral membrane protein
VKLFYKILAWYGLLLIASSLFLSFSSSRIWIDTEQLYSAAGYMVTFIVSAEGTLFALVGGFILRTKYLWMGNIAVGLVYISSFYGYFVNYEPYNLSSVSVMLLPGVICIISGVVIWRLSKPTRNQLTLHK